jgi:hypothetical protein
MHTKYSSHVLVTVSCHVTASVFHVPEDSPGTALNEVIGLDGVKVVKIAAGAEHSALVTGKLIYYELLTIFFFFTESLCHFILLMTL